MRRILNFSVVGVVLSFANGCGAMYNMYLFVNNVVAEDNIAYVNATCVIFSSIVAIWCLTRKE